MGRFREINGASKIPKRYPRNATENLSGIPYKKEQAISGASSPVTRSPYKSHFHPIVKRKFPRIPNVLLLDRT